MTLSEETSSEGAENVVLQIMSNEEHPGHVMLRFCKGDVEVIKFILGPEELAGFIRDLNVSATKFQDS